MHSSSIVAIDRASERLVEISWMLAEQGHKVLIVDADPQCNLTALVLGYSSSDYFIIPTAPDFFCAQAIKSLSKVLPRWNREIALFRDESLIYPFPSNPPKFIGSISQKYRPNNGLPAKSFQRWIDIIQNEITSSLVPSLTQTNMIMELASTGRAIESFNLANIADFNSLIAKSQEHSTPVFNLSDVQIDRTGFILDTM